MNKELTNDNIKYIVARLIENANDAVEESKKNPSDSFEAGRRIAYYEMLDILRTELNVSDQDLSEYGLDFDLEKTLA